jgi:hypothetical protein
MTADQWIFLSKNGEDEYINRLAASAGVEPTNTDYFDYHYDVFRDQRTLVLRGILKYKIMRQCLEDHRTFYYMDSGYLGNARSPRNPLGNKNYHRIVRNDLQHGDIQARPSDRFDQLGIRLQSRRHGRRIIVAAPDEKPCRFYGIDRDQWIQDTVSRLQQHTDRPIVVRERAARRLDRVLTDPLVTVLRDDVHALVTFNSNAAVEAVIEGVPVFVTAPTHAAAPVGNRDLACIEDPFWPDEDLRHQWACHLAYGQYSVRELENGTAFRMINEP